MLLSELEVTSQCDRMAVLKYHIRLLGEGSRSSAPAQIQLRLPTRRKRAGAPVYLAQTPAGQGKGSPFRDPELPPGSARPTLSSARTLPSVHRAAFSRRSQPCPTCRTNSWPDRKPGQEEGYRY